MSRAMYRYQVGLDGPVGIRLTGDPVAVAAVEGSPLVEFWAEHDAGRPEAWREFIVIGTGHPVPDGAVYVGTAPRTRLGLVFHLYELPGGPS